MCVYSCTDEELDLDKSYKNGKMSEIFIQKINQNKYNKNYKKNYFFIVLNKKNPTEVIINSCKGLTTINPNNNNLPYQVVWNKNKIFRYKPIKEHVKMVIDTIKKPKKSWSEKFLNNVRQMNI